MAEAIPTDRAALSGRLLEDLESDGDFFGVIDGGGNTLQVLYHLDKRAYWFEISAPEERGSYGVMLDRGAAQARLADLPDRLSRDAFADFRFVSWLDDLPEP